MSGEIICRSTGDVLVATISQPDRLNALSTDMWISLREAFLNAASCDTLRCIVLEGAGTKAFSAGADISEFGATRSTLDQVVEFHEEYVGACLAAIGDCPVPTIAKIRGACMGGGLELATVCDIRLADETARFGAPVGKLGFPLAFEETQALHRLVGGAVAAELLIEGRVFNSEEARSRGIVTRVTTASGLDDEVRSAVDSICQSGLWAARCHKRQLRRLSRDATPITQQEKMEVYGFVNTEEYKAGVRRFLSKSRSRL